MIKKIVSCVALAVLLYTKSIISIPENLINPEQLTKGIWYQHLYPQKPCSYSLHLVELDPTFVELRIQTASNGCVGTAKPSHLAEQCNAYVACNGTFFHTDGTPASLLKINNEWVGDQQRCRATLCWSKTGKPLIERMAPVWSIKINNQVLPVTHFNQEFRSDRAVLYAPTYGATITIPEPSMVMIMEHDKVLAYKKMTGLVAIPRQGYVYAVGNSMTLTLPKQTPTVAQTVLELRDEYGKVHPEWLHYEQAIGGAGLLVKNSTIISDFSSEKLFPSFIEEQHPRTAVGILPSGNWIIAVIDERNNNPGSGVTLSELAIIMHSLGCTDALNLNGGKSATLYLINKIVSRSCGFSLTNSLIGITLGEKKLANIIAVVDKHHCIPLPS